MTAGASRILPFLGASVAVHVIAIGALGTQPPTIAMSPDGAGRAVSIHLEAAAPAKAGSASNPARSTARANDEPDNRPTERVAANKDAASKPARAPTDATHTMREDTAPATTSEQARADSAQSTTWPESTNASPPDDGPSRRVEEPAPSTRRADRIARVHEPDEGAASAASQASRAEARKAIVAELARYFHYPRLAQRHGWEGTVVLSVRILPDGRLGEIHVEKSSGRALLDRSAVGSLGHVRRLPQFASRVGDDGIALRIPVTYRLEPA
ncbi:MAG: TonB family protein [Halofilum sp. (in: g-proteobacteria)]|nr:TonB family protein [Halofilum sp. (in: g-proteobacteria)]